MPAILTVNATVMCPHGGQVSFAPGQTSVKADGAFVMRPGDTSTVAGCAFAPGGVAHPCVTIEWQNPAQSVSAGSSVLTSASIGLCKAGDQAAQGVALIQQTQQKASAQ